ncbi:SOS response-associated peptidase family protein [Marinobacter daepoensis]|uniref:SOS response-associated peptidase family protein n=1 Tax=Marinobacter daepoensis TaxID=262077 RepID=UPI001F49ECF0|nr:SOS response-associated peptidase family protein [Marinobacter daepoensis]
MGTSPLWKKRFHSQRAIIPASGFHEWTGEKGHKQCYNIHPADSAIAFAGLYELWDFQEELLPSFTIITLPPHPRFSHIHPKSIPLMLNPEDFDMWLDPSLTNTDPLGLAQNPNPAAPPGRTHLITCDPGANRPGRTNRTGLTGITERAMWEKSHAVLRQNA